MMSSLLESGKPVPVLQCFCVVSFYFDRSFIFSTFINFLYMICNLVLVVCILDFCLFVCQKLLILMIMIKMIVIIMITDDNFV